jgi:hypothetical protein
MPKSLHLPVESQFDIERILKSTLRPTVIVTSATTSGADQINTQQYGSCAAMPGCGTVSTTAPPPILNRIDNVRYSQTSNPAACAANLGYVFSYNTTFDNSSAFYSDINGFNLAADGYYSALSGFSQLPKVRQQSEGVLGAVAPCE